MSSPDYHRQYWQQYKRRKPRISLTLTREQHQALQQRAAGHQPTRTPGQQLWLEACAYRQQRYLPPAQIAQRLDQLLLLTRQVASHLQQTNPDHQHLRHSILGLHQQLQRFVQNPHDH